jgi:Flp pilus assembly protein CpaB
VENSLPSRLLKTRQGTIAVGIAAAVLAAILLLVYLSHYRSSVKGSTEDVTVLVAKSLIPKGTSGTVLATKALFVATTVPKAQLKDGAVTDPALLRGRTAVNDIYPSQQLTINDFTTSAATGMSTRINGSMRAVSIPLDSAHGITSSLQTGDHVDVYFQLNNTLVMGLLLPDVLVLSAPGSATGTTSNVTSNFVLQVSSRNAARLTFAAENGKVWLALRPQASPRPTPPVFATPGNIYRGR